MHAWDQNELAKKSGISRAVVSFHVTGSRPIRDDHLAAYITALDKYEQSMLVAAWLRDVLPEAARLNILDTQSTRLSESVTTWSPELTAEQRNMLQFWSEKIAADPELADTFRAITRKAGWIPSDHPPTEPTTQDLLQRAARKFAEENPPDTAPPARHTSASPPRLPGMD